MNLLSLLIPVVIILIAVFLMGFRIFLLKDGKFPNIHIGGSKALRDQGISCATTQDSEAQKKRYDIATILSDIEKEQQ